MKLCRLQFSLLSLSFLAILFLLIPVQKVSAYTELDLLPSYPISGLLHYYKFEDTADSYSDHILSNDSSVTFTSGLFNNAAYFGTSNTDKCLYNLNAVEALYNDSLSFVLWSKMAEPSEGAYQSLFSAVTTGSQGVQYGVSVLKSSGVNKIRMWRNSPNVSYTYEDVLISSTSYSFDEWNNVVLTYDAEHMRLYVNGTQVSTDKDTPSTGSSGGIGHAVAVGCSTTGYDGSISFQEFSNGQVDDFSYYTSTLTQGLIDEIISTTPSISGLVYWGGVGTQYGKIGTNWAVPYYWDLCDSYNDLITASSSVWLISTIDGDNLAKQLFYYDLIGPQNCKGSGFLNGEISATTTATGTAFLSLVDDPVSGEIYATSSPFNWVVNNGGDSTNFINSSIISPLKLPLTGQATTTLPFSYDFTGLAYSGGQVCVINRQSNTKTDICVNITAVSGVESMPFANPSTNYSLYGKYGLYSSTGSLLLTSDNFQLTWYELPKITFEQFTATSSHFMACSAAEWEDVASTDNWFNFSGLKCNTLVTLIDLANSIANAPATMAQGTLDQLKTLFPFNIPSGIIQSWNDSAVETLPGELAFLNIQDGNGNVYITLPSNLFGATSTVAVWGPVIFNESNGVHTVLDNIRILSKYLLWLLVVIEIIAIGKQIISDISGDYWEGDLEDVNVNNRGNIGLHYRAK